MSIIPRNRVASFGHLFSSKPGSTSPRARRASISYSPSKFGSLPSCPALSSGSPTEQEFDGSKRARVTSAPFMIRKGDFAGHGQAHDAYLQGLQASKLIPSQAATPSSPLSEISCKQPAEDIPVAEDITSDFSALSLYDTEQTMPKAPQLFFRSPVSQPRMLPMQSGVYTSMARPLSPQISYLSTPGFLYNPRPLSSSHNATIAAVLQPHRRSPSPESRRALRIIRSTEDEHVLSVHLPGFAPEMVTICARREDKLAVVADLWHAETNSHHEWLIAFSSRDANVQQTRALFSADGTLTIHVPRHTRDFTRMRSRLR